MRTLLFSYLFWTAETLELYFILFYAECLRKSGSYKSGSVNTI